MSGSNMTAALEFEFEYPRENERMIAWLQQKDPDIWHVVASHINFEWGAMTWCWIIDQDNCDRATPQFIWQNNSGCWDRYPQHVDRDMLHLFDRMIFRWNMDLYVRTEIATDNSLGLKSKSRFDWQNNRLKMKYKSMMAKIEKSGGFRDGEPYPVRPDIDDRYPGRDVSKLIDTLLNDELRSLFEALGTRFGAN
jgi:hypothetical protein